MNIEKSIIGSIIIDNDRYYTISEILSGEEFQENLSKKAFEKIKEFSKLLKKIDILSLSDSGIDPIFLAECCSSVISSSHAIGHAEILKENHAKKQILSFSKELEIILKKENSNDVMNRISKFSTGEVGRQREEFLTTAQSASILLGDICKIQEGSDIGIKTNIEKFDTRTSGYCPGDLVILAARPSVGKTTVAVNMAQGMARTHRVGFFSLEMTHQQLTSKLISGEGSINAWRIGRTKLADYEMNNIGNAVDRITDNIIICDTPNIEIDRLRILAHKMKRQYNIEALFIDYLQLVKSDSHKADRVGEISYCSRMLKAIAKELQIPVIALAQLRRGSGKETEPTLEDLKGSGSIEEDADIVYAMNRELGSRDLKIHCLKYRSGSIHKFAMDFDLTFQTIS